MPFLLAAAVFLALCTFCLLPQFAGSAEDQGDGRSTVKIPRHQRTPEWRPRTWTFFTTVVMLGALFLGLHHPSPAAVLRVPVARLAVAITSNPAGVAGYVARLTPASQFLAISYLLGLAVAARASLGRRAAIAAHAVLYLILTWLAQALMISVGLHTGWPVQPFSIEATLVNLGIGGLVVARVTVSSFVLPKPTAVPKQRPRWIWDTLIAAASLLMVMVLLVLSFAILTGSLGGTVLRTIIPMYASSILFVLLFLPLIALHELDRNLPRPTNDCPAVDVIVPAYNEEDNLLRLMRSVDLAASRYGGNVRVIISNDGSLDTTEEMALRAAAAMRFAQTEVLTGPNGGQAAALNRALAISDAAICVRVDADCVMGADALLYAVPWFRDPLIGTVGAVMMPRTETVTWFHRMRAIETLFQFRLARVAQSVVDGIVVIPGTFTAFRRRPVEDAGGYVMGMNGEDADLTMQIGRLGFRAVIDPRITSFEDVPHGAAEFLEQRTRWARAGIHTFARHNPFVVGSAGPRTWFWCLRRGFSWFSIQTGLIAPIYIGGLALVQPSYRHTVVTVIFLGLLASAPAAVLALPLAVKYRQWRSIMWMPTWFAFAFLRRLALLEAMLSLPTRPLLSRRGHHREVGGPALKSRQRRPLTARTVIQGMRRLQAPEPSFRP